MRALPAGRQWIEESVEVKISHAAGEVRIRDFRVAKVRVLGPSSA